MRENPLTESALRLELGDRAADRLATVWDHKAYLRREMRQLMEQVVDRLGVVPMLRRLGRLVGL